MFFDDLSLIPEIASKCGTSIFKVPADFLPEFKNAYYLQPTEKKTITIDQVRNLISKLGLKQKADQFIVINRVEQLGDDAANALLKNLEEPQDHIHFVLLSTELSAVLPTILSRAEIYFYRQVTDFEKVAADQKTMSLAKRLFTVKGADLVKLADEIVAKKDRQYALTVLDVAIQILYKSFFATKKVIFLKKLEIFLKIYENISKNGNMKLQIVGNLC